MGHYWPLFRYFRLFNTVGSPFKFVPMTGFEPRISGVESDHSTNCVTTPARCYENVSLRDFHRIPPFVDVTLLDTN